MTQAVILAGGKGTRLSSVTKGVPKTLIQIGNKPLLVHQLELLKDHNIKDIILCLHHGAELIKKTLGNGKKFGVRLTYAIEERPLGTAGAIKNIESSLNGNFLVLYGDVMVSMDLQRFLRFHKEHNAAATLAVHPNDHPLDSDLVEVDSDNRVTKFLPKPRPEDRYYHNLVNAAVYVLTPKVFKYITSEQPEDLGRDVFPRMTGSEDIYAYRTTEYIKDMGTPERLAKVERHFTSGRIARLSLENEQPAVFLDRDGVINKDISLIHSPKDFELLPKTEEAIRTLNESGFLSVVVTNQPMVARGLCEIEDVEDIHKKMETLLGRKGAMLDRIYYCPHHPDRGYPEENKAYKIECECRKPKTGMLESAKKEMNIDMTRSYLIGDSTRDILCGKNAGVKTIGVRTGNACKDRKYPAEPDFMFDSLYDAVQAIVKRLI